MTTALPISVRELDSRSSDGIDVRLLWREHDDQVFVTVLDTRTGEMFCLDVRDGARPLDVFHHPYAYAAARRVLPGCGRSVGATAGSVGNVKHKRG